MNKVTNRIEFGDLVFKKSDIRKFLINNSALKMYEVRELNNRSVRLSNNELFRHESLCKKNELEVAIREVLKLITSEMLERANNFLDLADEEEIDFIKVFGKHV